MKSLIKILIFCASLSAYGQDECQVLIADTSEYKQLEKSMRYNLLKSLDACKTIRTVVHVVYNGSSTNVPFNGFITPEQVESQIRITNQFFANDSLMANEGNMPLGIKMELARLDPDGMPTTGIIYYDGVELFGDAWATHGLRNNNASAVSPVTVASALAWGADIDGKKYLNTYVVPKIDGGSGGGVQAYAYFPTTNAIFGNYNLYNAFGSELLEDEYDQNFALKSYTDLGHTWTHELLHNFALFHTFQGNSCAEESNPLVQGDRVYDTPPQTPGNSCIGSCGFLSENVMDYINQVCKHRITEGQVIRANSAIQASLSDYLVCQECDVSADVNGDGMVNVLDLSMLAQHFGSSEGDNAYNEGVDLNCDGVISVMDMSIISEQFGHITIAEARALRMPVYDIMGRKVDKNGITQGVYLIPVGDRYQRVYLWNQ